MTEPSAVPDDERVEIETSGLDPERYAAVRLVGATHAEVMEAHVLGADLRAYAVFRSGHPHRRALDEAGAPDSPTHREAGRLGVSSKELDEVRASHRATIDAYWRALALEGRRPDLDVPVTRVADYLMARRAGLAHPESLHFAMRVATVEPRPDGRDLDLWARCFGAGLAQERLFSSGPRSRGRRLTGYQLEVLHALLFVRGSIEDSPIDDDEMFWVAGHSTGHRLDVHAYQAARMWGRRRRSAYRRAVLRPGEEPRPVN